MLSKLAREPRFSLRLRGAKGIPIAEIPVKPESAMKIASKWRCVILVHSDVKWERMVGCTRGLMPYHPTLPLNNIPMSSTRLRRYSEEMRPRKRSNARVDCMSESRKQPSEGLERRVKQATATTQRMVDKTHMTQERRGKDAVQTKCAIVTL